MKFQDLLKIHEDASVALDTAMYKLRGEITRLTRERNELIDDFARLNDELTLWKDRRQMLINAACIEYEHMCPNFQILDTVRWCDLWHEISQPVELDVRAEMMVRGCNLEPWIGLEE